MSIFSKKPEFMVVGLGNPGPKYELTRHNAGYLTLHYILKQVTDLKPDKLKFKALINNGTIENTSVLFVRPQTYMNSSGEAVAEAMQWYKIPNEKIIVIYDDTALSTGKMRIRAKGSDGGHKGMKSIISYIGSDDFCRIRIGIGAESHPDYDITDWVLGKFTDSEMKQLSTIYKDANDAVKLIISGEMSKAMNLYN